MCQSARIVGKNLRRAGPREVGRSDDKRLHGNTLTLLSGIAEMKAKQFYFLAEGFSATVHRNLACIIHTVCIPRLGLGRPNTHVVF